MENFEYSNPVKLLFGKGQLDNVAQEILPYGKRVLLVYGKKHIKESGVYNRIANLLEAAGITHFDLEGVNSNPRLDLVLRGIEICKNEDIDFILAVGGGSASDTAKAVGMGAKVDYNIWEGYEDFHNLMHQNAGNFPHVPNETIPIGVIMTKAGTGSEFDYTTVLSNHDTQEKLMIINKTMYPKFAIDDPVLTYTLPKEQLAFGTADIMTHYMEQYFSVSSNTEVLDRTKLVGMKTVVDAGKIVQENPEDYNAQANLLYCAAWACSDHSMTGVVGAWAPHMIEHEISAISDLNHGHGMAIVYLGWMKYVIEAIPEKFSKYAEEVWGITRNGHSAIDVGKKGIDKTAEYWSSLGIPLTLSEAGVDTSIIPRAAKQAVRFGSLGLIKQLNANDVQAILESVQ